MSSTHGITLSPDTNTNKLSIIVANFSNISSLVTPTVFSSPVNPLVLGIITFNICFLYTFSLFGKYNSVTSNKTAPIIVNKYIMVICKSTFIFFHSQNYILYNIQISKVSR